MGCRWPPLGRFLSWHLRVGVLEYTEVDFSKSGLSNEGLREVVQFCRQCPELRVLKLFQNQIDDQGCDELCGLFKYCSKIEELHLSHNWLTEKGVEALTTAALEDLSTDYARPLWLRVEHNNFDRATGIALIQDLKEKYKPHICGREDRYKCSNRECVHHCRLHIPFLDDGKSRWAGRWKKEEKWGGDWKPRSRSPRIRLTERVSESPRRRQREVYQDYPRRDRRQVRREAPEPRQRRQEMERQEVRRPAQRDQMPRHENPRHEYPRHEMPRHDMARHEMPRHEMPRHEMPRHDLARHQVPRHDMARHEMPRHEMPRYEMPRREMPRDQAPRHEVRREMPRHDTPRHEIPRHQTPRRIPTPPKSRRTEARSPMRPKSPILVRRYEQPRRNRQVPPAAEAARSVPPRAVKPHVPPRRPPPPPMPKSQQAAPADESDYSYSGCHNLLLVACSTCSLCFSRGSLFIGRDMFT